MNEPQIFELKPPRIRALQWTGDNLAALQSFCPSVEPIEEHEGLLVMMGSKVNGPDLPANNLFIEVSDWVFENGGPFFVMKNEALTGSYKPSIVDIV